MKHSFKVLLVLVAAFALFLLYEVLRTGDSKQGMSWSWRQYEKHYKRVSPRKYPPHLIQKDDQWKYAGYSDVYYFPWHPYLRVGVMDSTRGNPPHSHYQRLILAEHPNPYHRNKLFFSQRADQNSELAVVWEEYKKIKVGMLRREIEIIMREDGGISNQAAPGVVNYVFKNNTWIHVDVTYDLANPLTREEHQQLMGRKEYGEYLKGSSDDKVAEFSVAYVQPMH